QARAGAREEQGAGADLRHAAGTLHAVGALHGLARAVAAPSAGLVSPRRGERDCAAAAVFDAAEKLRLRAGLLTEKPALCGLFRLWRPQEVEPILGTLLILAATLASFHGSRRPRSASCSTADHPRRLRDAGEDRRRVLVGHAARHFAGQALRRPAP